MNGRVSHWIDVYRRLEDGAYYSWRYGLLVAACLAVPLTAGALVGDRHGAVIAGLAGWFIALAVPPATPTQRALFLGRRLILITGTTALGTMASHHLVWTLLALAALVFAVPAPGVTITPVITFIMGLDTPPGMSSWHHVSCFGAGGLAALIILLHPWAASPTASTHPELWVHHALRRTWSHLRSGSPRARYSAQLALVIPTSYALLRGVHWPHLGWVLVGILTTLRPSWDRTEARLVKRSVGMVGGSALTAACLFLTSQLAYPWHVTLIVILGALARPLRQYNYGFWPVLGTPVLLLLVSLTSPLQPWASAWRLGNNLLGAAITLTTITTLWPHAQQRPQA